MPDTLGDGQAHVVLCAHVIREVILFVLIINRLYYVSQALVTTTRVHFTSVAVALCAHVIRAVILFVSLLDF